MQLTGVIMPGSGLVFVCLRVEQSMPFILLGAALLLAFLAWNGVRKGEVQGTYDKQGTRDPRFYLRIVGYVLGAILFLVLALRQLLEQDAWYWLVGIVLGVVSASWLLARIPIWLRNAKERITQPLQKSVEEVPEGALEVKLWPLAATAFFAKLRDWPDDDLELKSGPRREAKSILKREWEVDNAEEFAEIQAWLLETGHRQGFRALVNAVDQMSDQGLLTYIHEIQAGSRKLEDGAEPDEIIHRIRLIKQDADRLRMNGFLAWDLLRYLDNCRLGYLAGYWSLDEAEIAMHSSAQVLQSRFASWREVADNFLLGREFWSIKASREDGSLYRNAITKLFDDPESLWHEIPFNLALA